MTLEPLGGWAAWAPSTCKARGAWRLAYGGQRGRCWGPEALWVCDLEQHWPPRREGLVWHLEAKELFPTPTHEVAEPPSPAEPRAISCKRHLQEVNRRMD